MNASPFREIWVDGPYGQMVCALINGEAGCLMYLRESGDAGFSSRNPGYVGAAEAVIPYVLSNGQEDKYPAAWAYPVATVEKAIEYFRTHGIPPPFISWHNDSGDGLPPGPKPNPSFQRTASGGR